MRVPVAMPCSREVIKLFCEIAASHNNVTLPRPEGGGKGFYPLSEVDPDTRGGKTFATEREGEVMSLFYDLSPRASFWVYLGVIAFRHA